MILNSLVQYPGCFFIPYYFIRTNDEIFDYRIFYPYITLYNEMWFSRYSTIMAFASALIASGTQENLNEQTSKCH